MRKIAIVNFKGGVGKTTLVFILLDKEGSNRVLYIEHFCTLTNSFSL